MTLPLRLSYNQLDHCLFTSMKAKTFSKLNYKLKNNRLCEELNLQNSHLFFNDLLHYMQGQHQLLLHAPIAQAYAGHQFGNFNILGDGRALLLGELEISPGNNCDIQLKGSGRTPYSRHGDGKASLGPMLREYIMSEAMHALSIPSSRSLALLTTDDIVYRQEQEKGAMLIRVAKSHIRIGTFQYAAIQDDDNHALKALFDYSLQRHYPQLLNSDNAALALLRAVMEKQVKLICEWLRVGFIHGVMNTDNITISGETLDYGPCAFMNTYDPNTVFSSVDYHGLYAFGRQTTMAKWSLMRFAETLLPLIHSTSQQAIELAQSAINDFDDIFLSNWLMMMGNKIGLHKTLPSDKTLIDELLATLQKHQLDYTHTFVLLSYDLSLLKKNMPQLNHWIDHWLQRLQQEKINIDAAQQRMRQFNPCVIPRNHLIEKVIVEFCKNENEKPFHELIKRLLFPYQFHDGDFSIQKVPDNFDSNYQTFCGT